MKPLKIDSNGDEYNICFDADGKEVVCSIRVECESLQGWNQDFWLHSYGERAAEEIKECILSFKQAKEAMTQDTGTVKLVGSNKEVSVKNKKMLPLTLAPINKVNGSDASYVVSFNCEGKIVDHKFNLRADSLESIGIDWDDDFWKNLDGEISIARPLFRCIAAFYKLDRVLAGR